MNVEDWNRYAEEYNNFSQKFTSLFAKGAFESVNIQKDDENIKILDIATGTGSLSIHAAKNIKGNILAIDYSPCMIEQLKKNIYEQNLKNINVEVMDGMNLKIENNLYDYVFSIFGVTLFTDPIKGLKEIYRVLKLNGIIIIAAVKTNDFIELIKKTNEIYYKKQMPSTNLPFSIKEEMAQKLKDVGFNDIKLIEFSDEIEVKTYEDIVLKDHPMYSNIEKKLGKTEFDKFMKILKEIVKNKYPNLPAKVKGSSLIGIGIKN